jgi:hypothetical protein
MSEGMPAWAVEETVRGRFVGGQRHRRRIVVLRFRALIGPTSKLQSQIRCSETPPVPTSAHQHFYRGDRI